MVVLNRTHGDRRGMVETLTNLGVLAQERGDLECARQHYEDVLEAQCELRHTFGVARILCNLGEVAELRDAWRRLWNSCLRKSIRR